MSEPISNAEVETRLWKHIEHNGLGMLGLVGQTAGASRHFQPMTAFAEPDRQRLWFFTRDDTDLARDVADGAQAMFVLQAKDHNLQACIAGDLHIDRDRVRIDKYWSAIVAAWYPQGRDDPHLTLLCFDATDAQVWLSTAGPVKFGWEIAKANLTGETPDVGSRASLKLN